MASYLLRSVVNPILPWEKDQEETSRYYRILVALLVASLILSIIIPFLEVEKPDRNRATSIPPRLVKMVLEQKREVKPPPPPEVIEEEPEPEPEPEKAEEEKPKEPEPKPEPKKETAKEVAKKHIAVFDALADLRDPDDMQDLRKNQSLSNDAGQAQTVTRSLITKKATSGSGGIQVATASRSSGTGSLAGQNTTNVESEIDDALENTKRVTKSGSLKRSSENINLAFESHKGAIFTLYQRALRKDPSLQGRVNFRLTIDPSGKVTQCSIDSTELNNPALEKRLIARIKRINFGALDVAVWEGTYLINFFPS
ncbi:AgmX/PglI C-terminal domain-containing protein [Aliikangiella marina]|uniref:AgmX/PglI C-terminal domain-containing protein n=1 Tax=Aliikangiella marina TaxID=1712262 RepID=A0A545TIN1_9GAMM|nr:AgmX/PglI C-terminal domain-containing protein [Aliikangiella marina]TQV77082.1 AgmX/PglI C-terminal domain-containing protein [Aliikangiella marina]